MIRSFLTSVAVATLALATATTPAHAGPPWISIELPANPLNSTTRGAYLLVHSYHHGDIVQYPLSGTATGLVNGKRQVVKLAFERTNMAGVSALRQNWTAEGTWVLAINIGGEEGPTALVSVVAGKVRGVNVPTQTRDGFTMGRKVTQADVDRALKELAVVDDSPSRDGHAGELALALIPIGLGLLLIRRR